MSGNPQSALTSNRDKQGNLAAPGSTDAGTWYQGLTDGDPTSQWIPNPVPVAPPTPFVPAPLALTPAQNAAAFTPPPNQSPTMGPLMNNASTGPQPSPSDIGIPGAGPGNLNGANNPWDGNWGNMGTGKGMGKGPSTQQFTAQGGPFPGTSQNPMNFHTQLQNFINSGLMGGQQRLM